MLAIVMLSVKELFWKMVHYKIVLKMTKVQGLIKHALDGKVGE
jgi:hypothetical protein